jgi:acyl carrier protein
MNLETFLRGTRPKVEGSISLNNLFQDDTLDFFVFFSSVVAVVGRPGQAYYSAANIFMAALAEQRRRKGLAASVIHIGPIYGLGYASEQGNGILNKERLRSSALVPVSEREFYQLFSEAVMVGRPGSVQGPMEFLNGVRRVNRYDDDQPDWAGESMMSHWIKTSDALAATLASDTELKVPLKMQLFEARDSTQVHSIVLDALFPKICSIFQIDSKKIDKKALETMRLDEMGIDSLVAVEIRSWFVKTLEIDVPVLKILSGVPIGDLVSFAAEKIPDKFVPNLASSHSTTKEDYSEKSDPPTSEAEDYGLDSQGHSSLIDEVVSSEASSEIFSAALKVNIDENNGSFNEDATTVKASPIVQRILRLSFSQELLWFVWSFLGDKTSLNHTAWARITGEISETGIREAFRSVSQQHEALRTRFIIENGRPVQAIMASSMWDLEVKSIQSESEVQQTVRILKDNHVYDVERGITGRAMLLSLTPVEHFMVAGLHPLVADGFSFQTLLRGVQELYLDPDSSHIKNRRRQFADHSEQQHVNLAAGKFDDDIRFWREQFASVPPSLPILTISNLTQRPAIVAYENEEAVIRVSVETKKRVQTICRRYRITPFHFYLAAFRTLLLRYTPIGSADDDVVVGIGDANRTEDELVDVIGPLVNILPIRLGASESMEFDELLRETRDKMYGALEHSRVPMQVLLNRLV